MEKGKYIPWHFGQVHLPRLGWKGSFSQRYVILEKYCKYNRPSRAVRSTSPNKVVHLISIPHEEAKDEKYWRGDM